MGKIKRAAAALVLVGALGGSAAVPVASTIEARHGSSWTTHTTHTLAGDSWTYQASTVSPDGDSWT